MANSPTLVRARTRKGAGLMTFRGFEAWYHEAMQTQPNQGVTVELIPTPVAEGVPTCECGQPVKACELMGHEAHMRFHRPVDPARLAAAQRAFLEAIVR